ncbi:reticulon-like protein B5 [Salvia miltiorrhiza]|uniref:reticulon-like protein B5 n=1 Tax=Salvia miltiorrhiza TaxID=226208 RepID=UPI0025AD8B73|nr:reticulon-like protein B5 [Salvia miltiorrhiza]XP_057772673.1 reticulon-like protein B5 [Salvia miltiorrhiza]
MDQEFEDSSEEKLNNDDEHQEQGRGLGLDQDEEQDQVQDLGLSQGQGQGQGQQHGHVHEHGQGQVQSPTEGQSPAEGQGQGRGLGHLFGRQKPVHSALGGGTSADVILWRNKQMSAALLAGSTVIWLLFEWIGYHLIPFICHFLILALASLFLWSNLAFYVHKAPLNFPEIELPQDLCMTVALLLRDRCNQGISMLWEVASGKDLKRFLTAIFALWIISIVGSWFDFLTIVYIINVLILTMPPLYEKHEDQVDSYALKAKAKLKRQYSKLDEKLLQKLPKVPFISDNKQH